MSKYIILALFILYVCIFIQKVVTLHRFLSAHVSVRMHTPRGEEQNNEKF